MHDIRSAIASTRRIAAKSGGLVGVLRDQSRSIAAARAAISQRRLKYGADERRAWLVNINNFEDRLNAVAMRRVARNAYFRALLRHRVSMA